MAGEIQISYTTGSTLWAMLWNNVGQVWNGSSFEAYQTANIGNYDIALTEQGTASEEYIGNMPAVAAGIYRITVRSGSVAEGAKRVGGGVVSWDGSALVPAHTVAQHFSEPSMIAGKTPAEHERYVASALAGKVSGAGTGTEVFKDYQENTRLTVTVDMDGNRTGITYG